MRHKMNKFFMVFISLSLVVSVALSGCTNEDD